MTHPMLKFIKRLTHPIVVFVALQIVLLAIVALWVFWFVSQQETLARIGKIIGSSSTVNPATGIVFLVIGCVLLGIILVGTVVLFVFTQVQSSLLHQQKSFVSSVTHELRSPLASLQLSVDTLQRRKLTEQTREVIFDMVNKDLERLAQLVERILIAGRLDKGIVDYKKAQDEIDLRDLLLAVSAQQKHLDHNLEQRLHIICEPSLTVLGSRLGLTIVFSNLLENAIKYSPRDSSLFVRVEIKDFEIWISFEDQGIGLSKKEQRKVFKIFHRSPRALAQAVPGTGLGLYIVKQIVLSMGGRIWINSDGVGRGSKFVIALTRDTVLRP